MRDANLHPSQHDALDELRRIYLAVALTGLAGSVALGVYLTLRGLVRRSPDLIDAALAEGRDWADALTNGRDWADALASSRSNRVGRRSV